MDELLLRDTKFGKFHGILRENSIQNEIEAGKEVFGKSFSTTRYKALKTYYISRALENTISLDISRSDLSEHTKAIFKGYKFLFYIRTLFSLGNRSAGIHFAKRLLKLGEKFELYHITIPLLDELRRNSVQLGKEKDHKRYLQLSMRHTELMVSESKIKALEEEISIHFTKSLFVDEHFKSSVKTSLRKVKSIFDRNDTYFNRLSYYRMQYIFFQLSGSPLESAKACTEAIQYMESKPHMSPRSRFGQFALYQLENFILARDYERGTKAILLCKKNIDSGMNIWFTFKGYEFLFMMQSMKFQEASNIVAEVFVHPRYRSLPEFTREKWQLFEFHIKYAMQSASNDLDSGFRKSYLYRNRAFKKRLADFPSYRKDKRGFNVAILILNILVLLEERKFDLLVEHEDALSSYRFKYLNQKHCRQSFALLKLVRIMTKNGFDLARIEKKASAIEKLLADEKLIAGEVFETIQIFPTVWVWSRIKTILANRR